jgi:hypothetical protein
MSKYHDRQANKLPKCECGGVPYGAQYYSERMQSSYGFAHYAVCRGCQRVYLMNGMKAGAYEPSGDHR